MSNTKKTTNFEKFTKLAIQDFKFSEEVKSWSNKEIADFLINHIWSKEAFGTLNIAVLDRVIEQFFELDTIDQIAKTMQPNKNAKSTDCNNTSGTNGAHKCICKNQ